MEAKTGWPQSLIVEERLGMSVLANTCVARCAPPPPQQNLSSVSWHLTAGVNAEGSSAKTGQAKAVSGMQPCVPAALLSWRSLCAPLSLQQSGKMRKKRSETESVRSSDRGPTGVETSRPPDTARGWISVFYWFDSLLVFTSCGRRKQLWLQHDKKKKETKPFPNGWTSLADCTLCLLPCEEDHWLLTSHLKTETTF